MTVCGRCGQENPDDARFCSSCGAALVLDDDSMTTVLPTTSAAPDETTSSLDTTDGEDEESQDIIDLAIEGLLPGTALLVVQRGPSAGSRYLLDSAVVAAGRHPDSDIFLDDVTVSRRHAEFVRRPEGYHVRDVGSLNGTYVNRDRIDDAILVTKDEVQIGKFRLVYVAGPPEGEA